MLESICRETMCLVVPMLFIKIDCVLIAFFSAELYILLPCYKCSVLILCVWSVGLFVGVFFSLTLKILKIRWDCFFIEVYAGVKSCTLSKRNLDFSYHVLFQWCIIMLLLAILWSMSVSWFILMSFIIWQISGTFLLCNIISQTRS